MSNDTDIAAIKKDVEWIVSTLKEGNERMEKQEKRIACLEQKMWAAVGATGVIVFVVDKLLGKM